MPEKLMWSPLFGPPLGPSWGKDACGVATRGGSALEQIAAQLLRATALAGILLVRNCARLAAQFDAQESVLERVEVRVDFLLDLFGEWNLSRRCRWRCRGTRLHLRGAFRLVASRSWGRRRGRGGGYGQNGLPQQQSNSDGKNRREAAEQNPFFIVETRGSGLSGGT